MTRTTKQTDPVDRVKSAYLAPCVRCWEVMRKFVANRHEEVQVGVVVTMERGPSGVLRDVPRLFREASGQEEVEQLVLSRLWLIAGEQVEASELVVDPGFERHEEQCEAREGPFGSIRSLPSRCSLRSRLASCCIQILCSQDDVRRRRCEQRFPLAEPVRK